MEFKKYIKLKNRMTKINDKTGICGISCEDCPFERDNNGYGMHCAEFEALYPEVAEAIVKRWADEHKEKI